MRDSLVDFPCLSFINSGPSRVVAVGLLPFYFPMQNLERAYNFDTESESVLWCLQNEPCVRSYKTISLAFFTKKAFLTLSLLPKNGRTMSTFCLYLCILFVLQTAQNRYQNSKFFLDFAYGSEMVTTIPQLLKTV